ncbi:unnamed protein product [Heligmosomoides polygyrus]|uniref:RGS domain-containing protein n=1 Tax=Heligmosomoides polygyrus TaxID=6339 RepID=A0A183GKT9_HELPZ|nr:unnamed protein product [Heligmosomoides polygyrus]
MTAVPVLRSTYVPIKVTSDYDDIFRRYLCCLLIKKAPKLFLSLIGTATLRSIRREEVIESLLSDDNDLHQSFVNALDTYIELQNRSETIIPTPLVVMGLQHRTVLKPRPMSLDLLQDHFVSCTARKSTLLRSSASTNSHERTVNVPTFSVATQVLLTWIEDGMLNVLLWMAVLNKSVSLSAHYRHLTVRRESFYSPSAISGPCTFPLPYTKEFDIFCQLDYHKVVLNFPVCFYFTLSLTFSSAFFVLS